MTMKLATDRTQDLAWIGDSILSLFVRQLILVNEIEHSPARGELFAWFTSNQFLASFGRPTEVEARIGRVYQTEGIDAAFAFIASSYLPTMQKQLANRRFLGQMFRFELTPSLHQDPVSS
jgi:hypothetical protein